VRRSAKAAYGRPRLSVFRSSKQIYAQIIDDAKGVTLVAASTLEKDQRSGLKTGADMARRRRSASHRRAGAEKGIKEVVFDRGSYLYHGRVKALGRRGARRRPGF
jgi:large subunit ribosomal protein L18